MTEKQLKATFLVLIILHILTVTALALNVMADRRQNDAIMNLANGVGALAGQMQMFMK